LASEKTEGKETKRKEEEEEEEEEEEQKREERGRKRAHANTCSSSRPPTFRKRHYGHTLT